MSYTPGPWVVFEDQRDSAIQVIGGGCIVCYLPVRQKEPRLSANRATGRLIAAAPDLLEALKTIEHELSDGWQAPEDFIIVPDDEADTLLTATAKTLDVWKRIRAAIAKAEGRS